MEVQGSTDPKFSKLKKKFARVLKHCGPGGGALAVYHRGRQVAHIWGGMADKGQPWQEDTLALSFSTTKGVASTLLHVLIDQGYLHYEDPVCKYWPEFAENGKEDITIRQVMSHEAGLYDIRNIVDSTEQLGDWKHVTSALAASPPTHKPGKRNGYHGITYGFLIGELVDRATGKHFRQVLDEELMGPLATDGLIIGMKKKEEKRVAHHFAHPMPIVPPEKFNEGLEKASKVLSKTPVDPYQVLRGLLIKGSTVDELAEHRLRATINPSFNGLLNASSLARMYGMLANMGEVDGKRLISKGAIYQMSQRQNKRLDRVLHIPMHWRLGYHRVFTVPGRRRVSRGFGHFGFAGSGGWADPKRNLSLAFTTNYGGGTPVGDVRIVNLSSVAARLADKV